jgi:uncharacterized membrane protein YkvA (DUF1232 family)
MDNLLEIIKIAAIVAGIIILLLVILLSLPNSPLRKWLLKIAGSLLYAVTLICIVYIISPIDALPDVLPLIGQVDDVGALITGVLNLAGGTIMFMQGKKPLKRPQNGASDPTN